MRMNIKEHLRCSGPTVFRSKQRLVRGTTQRRFSRNQRSIMSLQYKAYLYEDRVNRPKEIRRFPVDEGVSSSYEYLRRKIASVFPNLVDNFTLQWRDNDGDLIWLSSDEELIQALSQLNDGIFYLYVKQTSSNSESDEHCGAHSNWPGAFGGFGAWVPPPFHAFSSEFPGQCPIFQQQQQSCGRRKAGAKQQKDSHSKKPTTSSAGEKSSDEESAPFGEDNFQQIGNSVAEFLQLFGIDVGINVEHKGNKSACPGTKKQQTSSKAAEQATTSSDPRERQQKGANDKDTKTTDCTLPKMDQAQGESEESSSMETDEGTKLKEALARLTDMGFNDNGGWLTNLLTACEYDIVRVLEAMQPARDPKA